MDTYMRRALFWTPRVLCILVAIAMSLFALDVFGEGRGVWDTIVALLMHLIPTLIVVIVLLIAWRREWVGAALFTGLGLFYLVSSWGQFHWSASVLICGIFVSLGGLFWLNWQYREELRGGEVDSPVADGRG